MRLHLDMDQDPRCFTVSKLKLCENVNDTFSDLGSTLDTSKFLFKKADGIRKVDFRSQFRMEHLKKFWKEKPNGIFPGSIVISTTLMVCWLAFLHARLSTSSVYKPPLG